MNISLLSSFTAFTLTEEEELAGYNFHEANRAIIQNHISAAAEKIIHLELAVPGLDSIKTKEIEVAFLRGNIEALRHLLDQADILREKIQEAKERKNQQDPLA